MSLAWLTPLLLTIALAGCGSHDVKQVSQPKTPAAPEQRAVKSNVVVIPTGPGHLAAMAGRRGLTLRNRPGGRVVAHLRPRTEWGSPTVVWAAERRGRWLGVISAAGNNRLSWLDVQRDRPRMWRSLYSLHADLSNRQLELWRGSRVVKRMSVGIGGPATPTPVGRFTITDKLIPDRGLSYYGCCLLALSGRQPHLRPGWAGGDRIAIHGGSTGTAASAGCIHAADADLKRLMKVVPIGTPVYIRA
jgi:hypothetical protein